MPSLALDKTGMPVDADQISIALWETIRAAAKPDDYRMTCCKTSAVLKISANGKPFFAHYNDECSTAPETVWHEDGKALIRLKLAEMGIDCREEVPGGSKNAPWQADTLFSVGDRNIVIELQRSYQHLRDYLRRQERYAKAGVESYWLTREINYGTVASACRKLRLKRDFNNTCPLEGFGPLLRELPVAYLDIDSASILGAGLFFASVAAWLQAIIDQRFLYAANGNWLIQ